jgi:subtilase family serine protease
MARSIRAASPYVVSVGGITLTIPANRTSNLLIPASASEARHLAA